MKKTKRRRYLKKLNNESGVILITVILLSIVMAAVAVGIMSLNVSQTTSSRSVVEAIQAEQIALGCYAQYYSGQTQNPPVTPPCQLPADLQAQFAITVTDNTAPGTGPNGTDPIIVQVDY